MRLDGIGWSASELNSLKDSEAVQHSHHGGCGVIVRGGHGALKNPGSGVLRLSLGQPQDSNTAQEVQCPVAGL